jgi:hypothetical protein
VAAERLRNSYIEDDLFAYSVISLASADLERVRETFREIRMLVAASEPEENVSRRSRADALEGSSMRGALRR